MDWLEVYCLEGIIPCSASDFESRGFKVERRDYGTPQYREMFTVFQDGRPFVEIRRCPYSVKERGGIFFSKSTHVRMCNEQLYQPKPINALRAFLFANGYQYRAISRIDIALDFNDFDISEPVEGQSSVVSFIDKYMRGELSKVNQPRMSCHGTDKWTGRSINSLKWGANKTPNTTKLYNKSLELAQCHDKTYIREAWRAAGLDLSKDVWRIEFSLTSQFQTLRNRQTGERRIKGLSDYDSNYKLLGAFITLYQKYFDFREVKYTDIGTLIPKYKCPRVILFDWKDGKRNYPYEPIRNIPISSDHDRTIKMVVKRVSEICYYTTFPYALRVAAANVCAFYAARFPSIELGSVVLALSKVDFKKCSIQNHGFKWTDNLELWKLFDVSIDANEFFSMIDYPPF